MDLPVDLDDVRAVLRRHGVSFALVFGSHATGRSRPGSDLDLAVWTEGSIDWWHLRGALPAGIDLVDLRSAPEGLAGRVAMEGRLVMDDDPPARVRWQAQTRARHLDEAHRRERFRQDFVRSHG